MRKVRFRRWIETRLKEQPEGFFPASVEGTGCYEKDMNNEGFFHQWAQEGDDGSTWPVAIIESFDGTVQSVMMQNMKFIP